MLDPVHNHPTILQVMGRHASPVLEGEGRAQLQQALMAARGGLEAVHNDGACIVEPTHPQEISQLTVPGCL